LRLARAPVRRATRPAARPARPLLSSSALCRCQPPSRRPDRQRLAGAGGLVGAARHAFAMARRATDDFHAGGNPVVPAAGSLAGRARRSKARRCTRRTIRPGSMTTVTAQANGAA
jgi:hypothetical protein